MSFNGGNWAFAIWRNMNFQGEPIPGFSVAFTSASLYWANLASESKEHAVTSVAIRPRSMLITVGSMDLYKATVPGRVLRSYVTRAPTWPSTKCDVFLEIYMMSITPTIQRKIDPYIWDASLSLQMSKLPYPKLAATNAHRFPSRK